MSLINFDTYYFDLLTSNIQNQPFWYHLYNFQQLYTNGSATLINSDAIFNAFQQILNNKPTGEMFFNYQSANFNPYLYSQVCALQSKTDQDWQLCLLSLDWIWIDQINKKVPRY